MKNKTQIDLACMLREIRAEHELTQIQMAKKLNITQSELSRLESNDREIGIDTIEKVAKALKMDIAIEIYPNKTKLLYSKAFCHGD